MQSIGEGTDDTQGTSSKTRQDTRRESIPTITEIDPDGNGI